MKNLIIFDCFGVVLKSDVSNVWMYSHLSTLEIEYFRKEIFPKADRGEISIQEIFSMFSDKTKIDAKQIEKDFFELSQVDSNIVNFIKELKNNNFVVLLSNCPKGFLTKIITENQLNNLFDKIIISCDYHLIKPNIEIFNLAKNAFYDRYKKSIFIDDNMTNIIGAQKANIDYTIYHRNFETTKSDLLEILSKIN